MCMFKNTIKRIVACLCLVALLFSFCSCKEETEYDLNEISQNILEITEISSFEELSGTAIFSYFGFQDTEVKRFNVKVSATGESADTIACFEVNDEDGYERVVTGISHYLNSRSESFKTTLENEYAKIQSRLLVRVDNIIILVICDNYPQVTKYLTELGAAEVV